MSLGFNCSILAPHSRARARHTNVFPVPGGPYSSTPPIASLPRIPILKAEGCSSGSEMTVRRESMIFSGIQTSLKRVSSVA
jgi:hypothetical protein